MGCLQRHGFLEQGGWGPGAQIRSFDKELEGSVANILYCTKIFVYSELETSEREKREWEGDERREGGRKTKKKECRKDGKEGGREAGPFTTMVLEALFKEPF